MHLFTLMTVQISYNSVVEKTCFTYKVVLQYGNNDIELKNSENYNIFKHSYG